MNSKKENGDNKFDTFILKPNSNTDTDSKLIRHFKIICYYLTGIACFVAYNAILSGFDCFIFHNKDYYPDLVYPNLYFLTNSGTQLFLLINGIKFHQYHLLQIGLVITVLTLILNPLFVIYCSDFWSFFISCIIIAIQGITNGVLLICLYSFLVYVDRIYISAAIGGHAFSGVIMNVARLVTCYMYDLDSLNNDNNDGNEKRESLDKSFFLFYYLAAFFIMLDILAMVFLKRQKDVKIAFSKVYPSSGLFDDEVNYEERCFSVSNNSDVDNDNNFNGVEKLNLIPDESAFIMEENLTNKPLTDLQKLKIILKSLKGTFFISTYNAFITFSLYPALFIKLKINPNTSINIIAILLIFNISDAFSRVFTKLFYFRSLRTISVCILMRSVFLLIFPLIVIAHKNQSGFFSYLYSEYFIILCIFISSFSHGFLLTNIFIFISQTDHVNSDLKSKTSSAISVSINIGCYMGSTFAYLLNYLIF
jgi:hypothetical protein